MKRNENYIAMCGLDCEQCDAFIATKNNDNQLRKKTAKEWTERYRKDGRNHLPVRPEDINCKGCLSNSLIYLYCRQCKIRKCGLGKGLNNCEECKDYKCKQLIGLQSHFF